MRSFPFRYHARLLEIVVVAIDEGWELWVSQDGQRIAYGARVTVEEAIAGWRVGDDRVLELAEEVKSKVLTGRLAVTRPTALDSVPAQDGAATAD
jgi:hypothetical protein